MKKPPLSARIRYAFDNTMSKGTVAMIVWLALVALIVIVTTSLFVWLLDLTVEANFLDQMWAYLIFTLGDYDPMTEMPWTLRLATLAVIMTGIFLMSTLIGVLTTGLETKLEQLRKGRSKVIENDHTAILGWSPQIFNVVSELSIANENQDESCIVLMGQKDKVEMEDAIQEKVGSTGSTRIVCRTGNPMEMGDLEIVSLNTTKSIVILAPENDDPDAAVIKTLLAITNNPNRRSQPYHIVTEIHDPRNVDVARMVGKDEVEVVFTGDLIARLTAQTCRQSGLSVVYNELLNFEGDEIYFQEEPSLVGQTFGDALLAYEDSAVLGVTCHDGSLKLNPPMDTVIEAGDRIIAISEDDDTVIPSGKRELDVAEGAIRPDPAREEEPEQIIILGWNWRGPIIINELDNYVPPGSALLVVAKQEDYHRPIEECCGEGEKLSVSHRWGDITHRDTLDDLPFGETDHVILLSPCERLPPQEADARTLITLLHLRDIASRLQQPFSIVSEMMDAQNQRLAEIARADDIVVGDLLISLILSQISENKHLGAVFNDLFDPDGSEIYLKPAGDYVALDTSVDFYTVVESARRRGEVAIGYRVLAHAEKETRQYGVKLNPVKSEPIIFSAQDRIIVLAEM